MLRFIKNKIKELNPELVMAFHCYRITREFSRNSTTTTLTTNGFRFIGNPTMQSGVFEEEETDLIKRCLSSIDVFVDVGANVGFYTCLARHFNKNVISIEPSVHNLSYLYSNLALNGWNDVEVFPLGVGKQPGIAVLYGEGTGASLVRKWAGISEVYRKLIPLSTVDILLSGRFASKRLAIKIDAEGSEYDILQGAVKTLNLVPSPIWLVEVCFNENYSEKINPHFLDIFNIFWSFGYEARTIGQNSRIVSLRDVERWISTGRRDFGHFNYLFSKAE